MEIKEILKTIYNALDEKKAVDIKVIDISLVSSFGDYLVVTNGDNVNQTHAICDNALEKLGKLGVKPKSVEGYQNADWVLMDFGDIIINVFTKDFRYFYNLERVWQDGNIIDVQ